MQEKDTERMEDEQEIYPRKAMARSNFGASPLGTTLRHLLQIVRNNGHVSAIVGSKYPFTPPIIIYAVIESTATLQTSLDGPAFSIHSSLIVKKHIRASPLIHHKTSFSANQTRKGSSELTSTYLLV
ncbi:hypothetical protein ACMFMG_003726 [Clarireedia jacksonii]